MRSKASRFLGVATSTQLQAALPFLDSEVSVLVEYLLKATDVSAGEIRKLLNDRESVRRLIGVAAAIRRSGRDLDSLREAAQSSDKDVRTVAQRELESIM